MIRELNVARILITGLILALAFGLISQAASAQQFITFNYPGATDTFPTSINNLGEIIGTYNGADGLYHGFTLINGQFTAFNVPGAIQTAGNGINDSGEIVGYYIDSDGSVHGYLFNGKTYSTIDFPGSTVTDPFNINNSGEIVGEYGNANSDVQHGFSLRAGVFTTVDCSSSDSFNLPYQVNNFGVIAGSCYDVNLTARGFVYSAGIFTTINFPGGIAPERRAPRLRSLMVNLQR